MKLSFSYCNYEIRSILPTLTYMTYISTKFVPLLQVKLAHSDPLDLINDFMVATYSFKASLMQRIIYISYGVFEYFLYIAHFFIVTYTHSEFSTVYCLFCSLPLGGGCIIMAPREVREKYENVQKVTNSEWAKIISKSDMPSSTIVTEVHLTYLCDCGLLFHLCGTCTYSKFSAHFCHYPVGCT